MIYGYESKLNLRFGMLLQKRKDRANNSCGTKISETENKIPSTAPNMPSEEDLLA
jgi:hypothetical protein